jgi:hypothetical protein
MVQTSSYPSQLQIGAVTLTLASDVSYSSNVSIYVSIKWSGFGSISGSFSGSISAIVYGSGGAIETVPVTPTIAGDNRGINFTLVLKTAYSGQSNIRFRLNGNSSGNGFNYSPVN